jgi:hypothetical protein
LDQEVARFFAALTAFDRRPSTGLELAQPPPRLFQGPIAAALTPTGWLAILRRLVGCPMKGENYFQVETQPGATGIDQPAPAADAARLFRIHPSARFSHCQLFHPEEGQTCQIMLAELCHLILKENPWPAPSESSATRKEQALGTNFRPVNVEYRELTLWRPTGAASETMGIIGPLFRVPRDSIRDIRAPPDAP